MESDRRRVRHSRRESSSSALRHSTQARQQAHGSARGRPPTRAYAAVARSVSPRRYPGEPAIEMHGNGGKRVHARAHGDTSVILQSFEVQQLPSMCMVYIRPRIHAE